MPKVCLLMLYYLLCCEHSNLVEFLNTLCRLQWVPTGDVADKGIFLWRLQQIENS